MKANNVRTNEIENVIKISIGIGKIFDKPKSDIKERERERERERYRKQGMLTERV